MAAPLKASMFSLPDALRSGLAQASAQSVMTGDRKSINTCILEAIEAYLSLPNEQQTEPALSGLPLKHYTVRMPGDMKHKLTMTAAAWQIRIGIPVTMNAVVNTAILLYLQSRIAGFRLPSA